MENDFALGYAMGNDSGGSNSNDGFGGGGWGGLLGLIVVASLFGLGRNGSMFGGGGGGSGELSGIATRADITAGFQFQDLQNGIRGLTNGLSDATYALNNSITNGFHGVDNAICNLGYQTQAGFNSLSHQLSDCCCQTQRAIDGVNYNVATQFANLQNTMCGNTRDIIDAQHAGTRAILDFLTQDKIATLTAENQSLKFAASQASQNAFITANQEAQTAELIRRLGRDCPVPAYVVPNPNCCYGNPIGVSYGGNGNSGCGCGCGNGYTL